MRGDYNKYSVATCKKGKNKGRRGEAGGGYFLLELSWPCD